MTEPGSPCRGRARSALSAFAAIGLLWNAGPVAAQFNPESAAVQEAYSGDATPAKVVAARAGLLQVLSAVANSPGFPGSAAVIINFSSSPPLIQAPALVITSTLDALSDADLGPPGALLLDSTRLRALASFASPRDITVGAGGAIIDTGAFTLTLSGDLTANGALVKEGAGVLELTGSNVWNELPFVAEGRLRGNSVSLATSIRTASFAPTSPIAEIEFAQVVDGTYSGAISGAGVLLKSGGGTLSVDAAQSNSGGTALSGGTLRLLGAGTIGGGAVSMTAGTLLDLSGSNEAFVAVRGLSGDGTVDLGANRLAIFNASSTFGGGIAGSGGVTLRDTTLTLTGASTYLGSTFLDDAALILSGAGALSERTIVTQANGSSFSIAGADGDRAVGALSGDTGSVALGNNTLIIGAGDADSSFQGPISGAGGLVKTGSGRQYLSGLASYTGTTRIDGGILAVHPQAISNTVINNAELEFNVDAPSFFALQTHAYSGMISGTGQVSKTGDGVLWLRGSNTYSGGTEVHEGVLLGNVNSLPGAIVVNKGAVGFYQIDDRTHAGQVSGAGLLVKYGPGELTLSGSNTIPAAPRSAARCASAAMPRSAPPAPPCFSLAVSCGSATISRCHGRCCSKAMRTRCTPVRSICTWPSPRAAAAVWSSAARGRCI